MKKYGSMQEQIDALENVSTEEKYEMKKEILAGRVDARNVYNKRWDTLAAEKILNHSDKVFTAIDFSQEKSKMVEEVTEFYKKQGYGRLRLVSFEREIDYQFSQFKEGKETIIMSLKERIDALEKENKVLQGRILANTMICSWLSTDIAKKNHRGIIFIWN